MFEDAFKTELITLNIDEEVIQKLWSEIASAYTAPGRYYHKLPHLDKLVETIFPIRNEIEDWKALIFSIGYHDIVYNPLEKDNEARSAEIAYERLTSLDFPLSLPGKCRQQILATKHHQMSEDPDTNYFIDADLSVLGSDSETYLNYTKQIRKEYQDLPDLIYRPGRKKLLEHFLEMKCIFKTKYFQDMYEDQARTNISGELQSLCL